MTIARLSLLALLVVGCTTEQGVELEGSGQMWVSNRSTSIISRFERATTAAGDIVPTSQLRGTLTRLAQPALLTYDKGNDRLFVANSGDNAILIYDQFSQAVENVPPTRILQGANTLLNRPVQVKFDSGNDLLYVANAGVNSISVFANASTVEGAVAPLRTLQGSATRITSISSFELDIPQDRLWVANPQANSLLVFDQMSTLNGDIPPVREVSGGNTRLQAPQYLLRDGQVMYVSCTGALLRFEGIDSLAGNIAPTAFVTGQVTGLIRPQQLALRLDRDELYVADSGANGVLVFADASTANASPPPLRRLQGSRTGFAEITGLILDLDED